MDREGIIVPSTQANFAAAIPQKVRDLELLPKYRSRVLLSNWRKKKQL